MTARSSILAAGFRRILTGLALGLASGALAGIAALPADPVPASVPALGALAQRVESLLQAARENPDPRVYARIEPALLELERHYPDQPRSSLLRAWYEMSQHRFLPALRRLRGLHERGSADPLVLGLLSDALVETGAYAEAIEVTQAMLDRFPGLPAMARAAHLRFLHDDLEGAIALYRLALDDRRADAAAKAWVQLQMAELYLHGGKPGAAEEAVALAAAELPVAAKAMLARVRAQQGRLADARREYEAVLRLQPNPEYALAAYELAESAHDAQGAARQRRLLEGMARLDRDGLYRRVFAVFFAELPGRSGQAVEMARQEYAGRPDLYSQLGLAWALYRDGDLPAAREHCAAALRLGTPDPMLRYRASLILAASDPQRAARLRQQARAVLPYLADEGSAIAAAGGPAGKQIANP